jgi:hypothetical protein
MMPQRVRLSLEAPRYAWRKDGRARRAAVVVNGIVLFELIVARSNDPVWGLLPEAPAPWRWAIVSAWAGAGRVSGWHANQRLAKLFAASAACRIVREALGALEALYFEAEQTPVKEE